MNIFALHQNPHLAARFHCDKHVVKMILETAQILCTVLHKKELGLEDIPYRKTHANHPCTIWAGETLQNFNWLITLGKALSDQYTKRYGKVHKSFQVIEYVENFLLNGGERFFICSHKGISSFATAMPENCIIENDPIASYRKYYLQEKSYMAKWNKGVSAPEWFIKSNNPQ